MTMPDTPDFSSSFAHYGVDMDTIAKEKLSLEAVGQSTKESALIFQMGPREPSTSVSADRVKVLKVPPNPSELAKSKHFGKLIDLVNKGVIKASFGEQKSIQISKPDLFYSKIREMATDLMDDVSEADLDSIAKECLTELWPILCLMENFQNLESTKERLTNTVVMVDKAAQEDPQNEMIMEIKNEIATAIKISSLLLKDRGQIGVLSREETKQMVKETEAQLLINGMLAGECEDEPKVELNEGHTSSWFEEWCNDDGDSDWECESDEPKVASKLELPEITEANPTLRKIQETHNHLLRNPIIYCNTTTVTDVVRDFSFEIAKAIKFDPDWMRYTVRRPGFAQHYSDDQRLFGSLMAGMSHLLSEKIDEGVDFQSLLDIASYGRFLMATNQKNKFFESLAPVGIQRVRMRDDLPWITKWRGSYEELGKDLQKLAKVWEKESSDLVKVDENVIEYFTEVNGKKILLSVVHLTDNYMDHTSTNNVREVLPKIEKLYNDICSDTSLTPDEVTEKLGQFFFLFCQAKPVGLGDPSIGEMLFKAVFIAKGMEVPGWKEGVVPWEETMKEYDPVIFGRRFKTFFDQHV